MEIIKKAIEFHKKGEFVAAKACYIEFLSAHPLEAKAHHLLGSLYMQIGSYQDALTSLKKAFELEKSSPVECDLGLCYFALKDYYNAYFHLNNIAETMNSAVINDKICKCAANIDIYKLRDICAETQDDGKHREALKYLKILTSLCPYDYVAYNNLGLEYEYLSDFKNAESAYRKAIEIKPNTSALYNLSVILRRTKRYSEALQALEKAEKINAGEQKYTHAKCLIHLIQKDFSWFKPYTEYLKTHQSEEITLWWTGREKNRNATLVICFTEGFGDIFMMLRYLDFVDTSAFKKVVLIVPEQMYNLIAYNFQAFDVVKAGTPMVYNYSAILMELPCIYNLDFDHIPSYEKYLIAEPDCVEKWKGEFSRNKLNAGIFFAGNTRNKRTLFNRNVDFSYLEPLFAVKEAQFYSLQPENCFGQVFEGHNIIDLSQKISNFSDTAAIIENLDIVVTIDSSVAHLSGALGKKTILMLPYSADWRWFDDNKNTPWYKSVEIVKQDTEGDWNPVIEKVLAKIAQTAKEKN